MNNFIKNAEKYAFFLSFLYLIWDPYVYQKYMYNSGLTNYLTGSIIAGVSYFILSLLLYAGKRKDSESYIIGFYFLSYIAILVGNFTFFETAKGGGEYLLAAIVALFFIMLPFVSLAFKFKFSLPTGMLYGYWICLLYASFQNSTNSTLLEKLGFLFSKEGSSQALHYFWVCLITGCLYYLIYTKYTKQKRTNVPSKAKKSLFSKTSKPKNNKSEKLKTEKPVPPKEKFNKDDMF